MQNNQKTNALSLHEKDLIDKHLHFYKSLDQGTRIPNTDAQRDFIAVCKKKRKPTTEHEIAYSKYIGIYSPEAEVALSQKEILAIQESLNENQIKSKRNLGEEFNKDKGQSSKIRANGKGAKTAKRMAGEVKHEPNDERQRLLNDAIKRSQDYDSSISAFINSPRASIPDYEEGFPRPGWFTDEDWKKMRSQEYAAMKKNHKE